jgi:hypothetical protein
MNKMMVAINTPALLMATDFLYPKLHSMATLEIDKRAMEP